MEESKDESRVDESGKREFELGDVLLEFMEVSINLILYTRNIYPDGIFKKCQKYGISVMMSQHPDVNHYIKEVLASIRKYINKGDVQMLVLQITNSKEQPLEKFCFEMKMLANNQSNNCFLDMETHLRALLLKINTCESLLKPLPKGCSFQILVHTKRSTLTELQDGSNFMDFPWVRSSDRKKENEEETEEPLIIPIRSCSTQAFVVLLVLLRCLADFNCNISGEWYK